MLSYPQWQGSGRSQDLRRGASAAADVCSQYGPLGYVLDAGEGERTHGINHWTAILQQFRAAKAILEAKKPRTVLTAGGDCACDVAVIDYLHRQYPVLTVIWVDAHLDANTAETSPGGDFHGMPVATLMGRAPSELQALLSDPLSPLQFRYVGAHLGDPGEWTFQRSSELLWLAPGELPSGPIHIHFDLDALDPAEFPHVAYPDGKLSVDASLSLVSALAISGTIVGLSITEFAPADEGAVAEGGAFIERLCEAIGLRA